MGFVMRSFTILATAASFLATAPAFATPAPAAVTTATWTTSFDVSAISGNSSGNFGSIEVDAIANNGVNNELDFHVSLGSGVVWVNTPNHQTFAFNLSSRASGATVTLVNTPYPAQVNAYSNSGYQASGYGTFTNSIDCSAACASGASGAYTGQLNVKLTLAAGLSFSDLIATSSQGGTNGEGGEGQGSGSYWFAADIGLPGGEGGSYRTGSAAANAAPPGGGLNVNSVQVPEPLSAMLLASGLVLIPLRHRARQKSA